MSTAYQPRRQPVAAAAETAEPPLPPRLRRPVEGREIGGVCAGLAEHLGIAVTPVRIGFLLATFAGGAGLVAYLFLWALTPQDLEPTGSKPAARARGRSSDATRTLVVGIGLVVAGAAFLVQRSGVDLRLGILLPLLAVAAGAVITWTQLDATERQRWLGARGPSRRSLVLRSALGTCLVVAGVVVLVTQDRGLSGLWDVGVAALAVLAGTAFIAAPWALRLWNDMRDEQARRVRETERADIAAHLHDSVLQTLALIQRKADDPAAVARLARAQERELRGWLYAGPLGSQESLAAAVTEAAHEVEDLHGVPIELVVTGDRPMDTAGTALSRALREALLNAVCHGQPPVSAYVEVGPRLAEAFVRDHGLGFDLDDVPEDRLGVRESIVGRMTRHGGKAAIRRLEDGTEVSLSLPLESPDEPPEQAGPGAPAGAERDPEREPVGLGRAD